MGTKRNVDMMDLLDEELEGEDISSLHSEITIKEETQEEIIPGSTKATVKPKKSRKMEKDHITTENEPVAERPNTPEANFTSKKCKVLLTKVEHEKLSDNDAILMLKSFNAKQQVNVTPLDNKKLPAPKKTSTKTNIIINKAKNLKKSSKNVTTNKEDSQKISANESPKDQSNSKAFKKVIKMDTFTNKGKPNDESDSDDTISIDDDFDINNIIENEQDDSNYTVTTSNGVTTYKCKECSVKSVTLCFFRNHMLKVHGTEMPLYSCEYCGETFSFRKRRKLHILNNHQDDKQRFTCCKCDFETLNKGNMKSHVLSVHKSQVKLCDLCQDFWTFDKEQLQVHMKDFHESRITCKECGLIALSEEVLKLHVQAEHNKQTKFPCDKCNYFTTNQYNLKIHKQSVHEKAKFPCPNCTYVSDNGLSLALQIAKEAQSLSFKCEECDFVTTRADLLKGHKLRLHVLKDTFFACPECKVTVKNAWNLKQHRISQHGSFEKGEMEILLRTPIQRIDDHATKFAYNNVMRKYFVI